MMMTTKFKRGMMLAVFFGCVLTAAGLAIPQTPSEQRPENKTGTPSPARPTKNEQVRKDHYGDPLPPGAIARLGTLRLRHSNMTADAVFTPDGKTAIVSDWGGEVIYWDVATGREVRRLRAADGPVNGLALAISGEGKTLAAGGFGRFSLWEVATGKKLSQTQVPAGKIWQLLLTPDGKTLALHDERNILLWDVAGNKKLHELTGHKGAVTLLALSPDGKTLASASWEDGRIHLWDIASGKEKSRIAAGKTGVLYVAFSPDGKVLASIGNPSSGFRLWDAATGKMVRQIGRSPWIFAFFPDGKTMAGLEGDGKVHIYDVVRGKHLRDYESPSGNPGLSSGEAQMTARLVISPDGKTVAALGGGPNSFDLGDSVRGKMLHSFAGHRSGVMGLAFAADGKTIFSSAANDSVLVWDTATAELRSRLGKEWSRALALSPDGKLLATGSDSLILCETATRRILWDTVDRKKERRIIDPRDIIVSTAWSADGKTLISSSQDGNIRVWDPATGKQHQTIKTKLRVLGGIALSPDGAITAAGDIGGGTIHLWATDSGKELRSIATSQGIVSTLAFSPDGSVLVSGGSEGGICLSSPTTGRLLRRWDTKPSQIGCLVFSRDGRTLVSGHRNSSVRLWEAASGQERACFVGHRGGVEAVDMSRDGRSIASGSSDTTILVWDATGGARADAELSAEQLRTLWRDLRDTDAGRAYRALWQLALSPKHALPFLVERLHPAVPLDAAQQKQVDRLLADLDSDRFSVRQEAETELEKIGPMVEPALRKALESKPSLEMRQRIESVLAKLANERLRLMRALEAIEHMNTAEARRLLEALAGGAPHAWLTGEARAIRKRLAEQSVTAPER
ncbi:MAG TPA: WD40 repeat domain-containing protein [Gemmataceae bacterium]|nr:WD40 repeat domain-containing protein [Gemmataceae bacterium]